MAASFGQFTANFIFSGGRFIGSSKSGMSKEISLIKVGYE